MFTTLAAVLLGLGATQNVAAPAAEQAPAIPDAPAQPSTWQDIPEQTRYVMIMGAMDAAAASRLMGAPQGPLCAAGLTNIDLDARITAAGYSATGEGLEAALRAATVAKTSAAAACDDTARGYDVGLLSRMSDEHLSAYISQVVTTLDLPASCGLSRATPQDMQDLAARLAGGILAAEDAAGKPAAQIAGTASDACKARAVDSDEDAASESR